MAAWIAMVVSALALSTACGTSPHHQPPAATPPSASMPPASDTDPPAPPPDAAPDAPIDAPIAVVRYEIDGAVVTQEAFEALRATLEIEEGFLEGERMDGFVQTRKARVRGSTTRYEVRLDVSPETTVHSLRRCPRRGC